MLVKVNLSTHFICIYEAALQLYQTTKQCLICVKPKLALSLEEIHYSTQILAELADQ